MNLWPLLLLGALTTSARAVQVGDAAPQVPVPCTDGRTVSLADFKGSWVVLYFYPKAFTPGCTTESCALRDGYSAIQKLGAVILGASVDTLSRQQEFKAKYHLPFQLLADADKKLAKAFDVLTLIVASRKTFIIDPTGRIAYIFASVKTATHDKEVAAVLQQLQAQK